MATVVILYTPPDQPDQFERRYQADYLPAIRALPSVNRVSTRLVEGGPWGDPPYYRVETWHLTEEIGPHDAFLAGPWCVSPDTVAFARGLGTPMFLAEQDLDR